MSAMSLVATCSPRTFSTWCRSCSMVSGWSWVTAPLTPSTAPRTSTSTVRVGRGSCAPRLISLGSLAPVSARSPVTLLTLTEARATSISREKSQGRESAQRGEMQFGRYNTFGAIKGGAKDHRRARQRGDAATQFSVVSETNQFVHSGVWVGPTGSPASHGVGKKGVQIRVVSGSLGTRVKLQIRSDHNVPARLAECGGQMLRHSAAC